MRCLESMYLNIFRSFSRKAIQRSNCITPLVGANLLAHSQLLSHSRHSKSDNTLIVVAPF